MRPLIAVLVLAAAGNLCATTALAQTKFAASQLCAKPDSQLIVPVDDRPGHALGVLHFKCQWTTPIQIGSDASKDGEDVETIEISGQGQRADGRHMSTMQSGDKIFVSYWGQETMKDGALVASKGTWAFTGGTGNLKGIIGKGTYTCAPSGDSTGCEVAGEYELTISRAVRKRPYG
ncbi:MAG TPA: hypothetical protein VHN17_09820 [Steroidobacteraceae bacterium]|jgi:hypothetical protein|nr:hypothetical protein [Steroidobacteraceae bacterium]